jgi:dTDP-4-dehydrorhamnose reductase
MKVLVLGATGMLGHKMFEVLRRRFPGTRGTIRGSVRDEPLRRIELFQAGGIIERVSAEDFAALAGRLGELRPEVIVNCVGIIKQRPAAKDAIASLTLNALLPHHLAEWCAQWGGRLIHFSTDCVFDGARGGYLEDDRSDAIDLYGRTKYLGEVTTENAVTLRTSIIGRELSGRQSLLEWFLTQDRGQARGFTRAIYSGVTTNHLAEVVGEIIQDHPRLSGLYQVTGRTITKYDLLRLLREVYRLDVEIIPDDSFVCDRSMSGDKFDRATGHRSPPWPVLAAQLAEDPTPYQKWRNENAALRR